MGAVISLKRRDHITVGLLPMDLRGEVGKCLPQPAVKFEHASLVGLTAWLRRMIMEIIGEQFVEQLPITTALHFDRVAEDINPDVERLAKPGLVPLIADVSKEDSATKAVAVAVESFGKLDILVNN